MPRCVVTRHSLLALSKISASLTPFPLLCSGFHVKAAQFLSTRGDLCPAAVCAALAPLQDAVPAMPPATARRVVAAELATLGRSFDDVFASFDDAPLGSASVAQVHRATLRPGATATSSKGGAARDVAVKVQHEGAEALMALDLADLAALAYALQRTELRFDLGSAVSELRAQVAQEFDFAREARCMDDIAARLAPMRASLRVPRSVGGLVTRRVLVMDFLDGIPLTRLREKAGGGAAARLASGRVLAALAEAYGRMLFTPGPFQADPHPGNVLVLRGGIVGLLDYGQCKELTRAQRGSLAELYIALRKGPPERAAAALQALGVRCAREDDIAGCAHHAAAMFGTATPQTAAFGASHAHAHRGMCR